MSGMVLHPGHDELHGITVVLAGRSGKTYLGRWHEQGPKGVMMKDVAIHDSSASALSRDEWLARQRKFGVDATEKVYVVATEEAGAVEIFGG